MNAQAEMFPFECAEKTLLGGLMKSPDYFVDCLRLVNGSDFTLPMHSEIWELLAEAIVAKKEPCPASLYMLHGSKLGGPEKLQTEENLRLFDYMQFELFANAPATLNLTCFAQEVKKASISRQMAATGQEMAARAAKGQPINDLAEKMSELKLCETGQLISARDAIVSASEVMDSMLEHKDKAAVTGFQKLDGLLGGISPGDLTIIAARPGMGKTQFMLNLLVSYSKLGKACTVISLEMTLDQIIGRVATMHSGVNFRKFTAGKCNDDEQDMFAGAMMTIDPLLTKAHFSVSDLTPTALEAEIKLLKAQGKVDVVFVDYLQLMTPDTKGDNREREVAQLSKSMKNMAKKYSIAVVCLAQLNRAVESRQNRKPMVSDLRDSGSIEQDADQILMLFRPKYYDSNAADTLEISIVKNRHGQTGDVTLHADMNRGVFTDREY